MSTPTRTQRHLIAATVIAFGWTWERAAALWDDSPETTAQRRKDAAADQAFWSARQARGGEPS